MEQLMESLLFCTFFLYLLAAIAFVVGATISKQDDSAKRKKRWGIAGINMTIMGAVFQVGFIIMRVIIGGHFPTSNMFEFTAFLCFALVVAFIVIFFMYRSYILGAFAMPIAVILLAYASVYPRDVQPLIPALQSIWLPVHVSTAAIGQGLFGVAFVAGLIYLIHKVGDQKGKQAIALETVMVIMLMFASFSIVTGIFKAIDYHAEFQHEFNEKQVVQKYELPPIAAPYHAKVVNIDSFAGMKFPWFELPSFFHGDKAASKANSVIWSIFSGLVLYAIYFAIARKRLGQLLHPLVKKLNLELLDEIVYRSIVIGYPIFTLGALIFAMIWANQAWGRPWGWDPKETWAFITWMFYSAYLHLRLSRGWHGSKSAWLAVGGFAIIMINLIVINLVVSGLHSYA